MAFRITLFAGGAGVMSKAGAVGRGSGMLTRVPVGGSSFSLNPQRLLRREYFKLHPYITNGNYGVKVFGKGQFDAGHRASTLFSTEVLQTGKIGIENYRTIYFNKTIGNRNFSVAINPWKRTIFHEGPVKYTPKGKTK